MAGLIVLTMQADGLSGARLTRQKSTQEFVFLVEAEKPKRTVGDRQKALINSHIVKQRQKAT